MKAASNILSKILTYILIVLLCFGLVAGVIVIFSKLFQSDIYVVYGDEIIYENNDGISIDFDGASYTANFSIGNSENWGIYSVTDCDVKVVPNVTSEKNFDFVAGSKNKTYSSVTDLSSAFTEDKSSIVVDEEGNFSLYFNSFFTTSYVNQTMYYVLYMVYDCEITINDSVDISSYPYFAIQITSPDGSFVLTIPFVVRGNLTDTSSDTSSDTDYSNDEIIYSVNMSDSHWNGYIESISPFVDGVNIGLIVRYSSMTISFTAKEDQCIYDVDVYNATLDSIDVGDTSSGGNTIVIVISDPVDTVTIKVYAYIVDE